MKVVFAGGGTGGHFYPIIAVAEEIRAIARERRLLMPKLYYLAPAAFDQEALFENEIQFEACPAGKWRRYFSLKNYADLLVTATGFICALTALFRIYPDLVFSKGGYASVPVVLAARVLGIPVMIHESDAKPGRANLMASKFAFRIGVAFDSAIPFFPKAVHSKIARTGVPIRRAIATPESEGARQELGLDSSVPTVLVLGGSSGATAINDVVVAALPELLQTANVIHQTGKDNIEAVERLAKVVIEKSPHADRYHPFPYLNTLAMRRSAGAADLIISRAGITTIAEIALWRKPSILIPIPESVSHDQRTNAYAYAHTGAAVVLEQGNLTQNLLVSEVRRILSDEALRKEMAEKSAAFASTDAAKIIAEEIVSIGLSHESQS
ncbi:MAG TPA: UDP-N-acetylglucosamine--N-acetylmuramyl-(pentapeptide) pyrophosphoryl-undecaprenol N-acetylglucosamine transferase [Candidatus Paceibacterota bacterium]|nr:UDP-N-acetylglucosamine--N-acetylmuramyl-(pentapeptide) pyrophosphoryl-undecaprenol N-acetylglucosamine transferase [Candidatus Paceibacterota bacterium]